MTNTADIKLEIPTSSQNPLCFEVAYVILAVLFGLPIDMYYRLVTVLEVGYVILNPYSYLPIVIPCYDLCVNGCNTRA